MVSEPQVVLAIFVLSFTLILSEVVHRTIAAWFGSILILSYGHATGVFETHSETLEHTMLGWIEFEVIGLLLGMMVFAAILELCGFFEFVAVKASKMSRGDPWRLIVILGTFTTLISLVIDNVTAIIIIAPVTLRICNKLEINPVPPLMAEAILSDTGGVASMVGDPPNVMIAAEAHSMGLEQFGFNGFLLRLGLLTLIAWIATLGYFRWYYRDWSTQIPPNTELLLEEDEWDSITDRKLMNTTLAFLGLTVVMFSAKEILHLEVEIHAIALAGAGLALIAARPVQEELREGFINDVVDKVEWQALLFFAGLFILVGAVGDVGYLEELANWIFNNFGDDEVMLAVAIIWVSAISSAIVDNIPFTAAMIPVIVSITEASNGELSAAPLFWALAMGAGFGGNATPIGSSANVMTVAISERGPRPITTREWARAGFPVMIITCFVATIFMILFHGAMYS
ncbi:MAG: ArsB/NhaD family transporter [Candidatus Thalassarchaeaceae archaeon]|jgi:Na+/H+ antiporter NhaD/arsenite permease-like protein|nr:citrate transporter [Euryarchaeota archaeon]MDP7092266.1 ArsB/NhaD family transporter [Candidatus Thalassarchaeaceae archaeon]MDP7257508.1 ArsB/NhaD family transporter [Candidatus Thalassarchaeaceae archaeon]MDP7446497.1 ArsB/NhaD family transporter [Candidatus Thalassarchaeaceae archaeon]MDP7649072.1 ArsB/NhaD family transporter [Candidatus Thalassarchaeaceae archaeon]|tara:strand:- start:543 stop:1910 length:1368 start_codon:yes stop_codon:yes gene_type:complete